jgi:pyruvate formate lyase activating enzyme
MKEAMFWEIMHGELKCLLCPKNCAIPLDKTGFCNARKNIDGKLYSLVFSHPTSLAADPIEKKPLAHFMPGTKTFSFSTVGCNLSCMFCQNWEIARASPDDKPKRTISPEKIVELAIENNCDSISYTYVEPTIFYEYVYETAMLAHEKGLKNVMVTNGYINRDPVRKLYKYIDAVNIDLKSFSEDFYKKYCAATLAPVLKTIREIKRLKTVHVELTNLIIPGLNDNEEEIKQMCEWIKEKVGEKTPLHFSRFFPHHKMKDKEPTPKETLLKAKEIAESVGLERVHLGNI